MNEAISFGENIIGHMEGPTSIFIAGKMSMGILIVSAIIGLLICFVGLKMIRVITAVIGFLVGAGIGVGAAAAIGAEQITFAIIVLACATVLAAISFFVYRVGAFFTAFLGSIGVLGMTVGATSGPVLVVILVVSLILGILAVIFIEPIIIVITAVAGGMSAGILIPQIIGADRMLWIGYVIGGILAFLGMAVQFALHAKKVGKKEKIKAEKIKEENSMESEVEKARTVLEEDEEEEDEDDYDYTKTGVQDYDGKDVEIVDLDDVDDTQDDTQDSIQ